MNAITIEPLTRLSLRDQAHDRLMALILHNELEAGDRINESRLAEELSISRSPLREALNQLEEEGFVVSRTGRGYFVRALDLEEARELYVILADLEALAVRLAGPATPSRVAELHRLNDRIPVEPEESTRAIGINRRWHEELVAECPNRRLLEILASLHRHVSRYEHAYFVAGERRLRASKRYHADIIAALEAGEDDLVRLAIERHWLSDLDF